MNPWSQKTLAFVRNNDYLDKLQLVYPHEEKERDITTNTLEEIKRAYKAGDREKLLDLLLDLEKFPYKDSYVGFLREDRLAIQRNPETVKRIHSRLTDMGLEGIIAGINTPKEANTRRGNQFIRWAKDTFEQVDVRGFEKSGDSIVMLNADETTARDFLNKNLGLGLSKRPDFVAKAGKEYVVGEAKFLSSTGGNQGRAFEDGMSLANHSHGKAHKIFILDGIHWIKTGSNEFGRISHSNSAIFSVLLLQSYLNDILAHQT